MNHRILALLAPALGLLVTPATWAQSAEPAAAPATVTSVTVFTPAPASEDVALYLAPDATLPAITSLKADDPRLAAAKPAADAGWQTLELKTAFNGYAPVNTSRKDLSIQPGTPIHQLPDDKSPVVGAASGNPSTNIQSVEAEWALVSYPGPATVYFQKAGSAPPVTKAPVATPTPAPTPVAVVPVTAAPAVAATTDSTAGSVPRYFYGTFKQRTDVKIAGPVNAQYVLVSPNGQVVALVDMNSVVLANPITNYLNKPAQVFGTTLTIPNLPYLFVRAQLLQSR